jgi:hypothetical protein
MTLRNGLAPGAGLAEAARELEPGREHRDLFALLVQVKDAAAATNRAVVPMAASAATSAADSQSTPAGLRQRVRVPACFRRADGAEIWAPLTSRSNTPEALFCAFCTALLPATLAAPNGGSACMPLWLIGRTG